MPVKIQIPAPLREQSSGLSEVDVAGTTVATALADLVAKHPPLGPKIFDAGKLRPFVNVFVDDEDIRFLDEMETAVKEGTVIALIPAVAGG